MKLLLPLAVFLLAPAPASGLDVCKLCDKGKLCKPHAELERAEIERLRPDLESEESRVRIDALREIASLCAEHENVPGKEAAEILAAASSDDPSLRVRSRAIRLLTDGQHPETTVITLVDLHEDLKRNMFGLVPWLTGVIGDKVGIAWAIGALCIWGAAIAISAWIAERRTPRPLETAPL